MAIWSIVAAPLIMVSGMMLFVGVPVPVSEREALCTGACMCVRVWADVARALDHGPCSGMVRAFACVGGCLFWWGMCGCVSVRVWAVGVLRM